MERKLRQLLAIGFLALGMLTGAAVDPKKIEELFQQMSRPKIVQIYQAENEEDLLERETHGDEV